MYLIKYLPTYLPTLFKDLFSAVIMFILCISPKPYSYSPRVCFIDSKTKRRLAHPLTLKTKVKVSNYADHTGS